ncbi:Trm112 family protein [Luteimonas kalidii]|uniref:Trm112 family protein n=1 Tax=Luteimonas kalidii TaxID=3042025 RepID=A0ABT6JXV8_9GAMM|nr:Trm112 family protein [Luteimonas kalidii]MDH5835535.1 Trm112 family protein [Luteimonas kalidii]
MDRKLLDILVCPATRQPLAVLGAPGLAALNAAVAAGTLSRVDGTPQSAPLREALVTHDQRLVYRIDDGIPVLLVEEGIPVGQIADFPRGDAVRG